MVDFPFLFPFPFSLYSTFPFPFPFLFSLFHKTANLNKLWLISLFFSLFPLLHISLSLFPLLQISFFPFSFLFPFYLYSISPFPFTPNFFFPFLFSLSPLLHISLFLSLLQYKFKNTKNSSGLKITILPVLLIMLEMEFLRATAPNIPMACGPLFPSHLHQTTESRR